MADNRPHRMRTKGNIKVWQTQEIKRVSAVMKARDWRLDPPLFFSSVFQIRVNVHTWILWGKPYRSRLSAEISYYMQDAKNLYANIQDIVLKDCFRHLDIVALNRTG